MRHNPVYYFSISIRYLLFAAADGDDVSGVVELIIVDTRAVIRLDTRALYDSTHVQRG